MKSIVKQRGVTLIELMIASLLSLLVAYFIMNIMITSTRTATASDGVSEAQETGRFVMSLLQAEAQRAGYQHVLNENTIEPFANLCAAGFANLPPADNANCTFNSDANDSGDRIAIRWNFNPNSTLERNTQDCTGVNLAVPADTELVDVYWVESDVANNDPNRDGYQNVLRCATYDNSTGRLVAGSSAQTIASGILAMHILYGEFNGDNGRYVSADMVVDWEQVKAVKIALLTQSFNDNSVNEDTRNYVLFDADPYIFANDRTSRYIQSSTTYLYNQQ